MSEQRQNSEETDKSSNDNTTPTTEAMAAFVVRSVGLSVGRVVESQNVRVRRRSNCTCGRLCDPAENKAPDVPATLSSARPVPIRTGLKRAKEVAVSCPCSTPLLRIKSERCYCDTACTPHTTGNRHNRRYPTTAPKLKHET